MNELVDGPDIVFGQVVNEAGVGFLTPESSEVSFGRGSGCTIRFGHDPLDASVSRTAGRVVILGESRVAVENTSTHIAFDVKTPDGPLESVRPGALYSPPGDRFEIHYSGSVHVHLLRVRSFLEPVRSEAVAEDTATASIAPQLTDRQWEILAAYVAPIREGRTVPATHAEVARRLGWSMSLIRLESNEIWSSFLLGGVPMRDFPDKRDSMVDAAVRHGLDRGWRF